MYPCRVTPHFEGHEKKEAMIRVTYFFDDPIRNGGSKNVYGPQRRIMTAKTMGFLAI